MSLFDDKRSNVTERLKKRDDDRVSDVNKRREQKEKASSEMETVEFYDGKFEKEKSSIEEMLEKCSSLALPKSELPRCFDEISTSLNYLQKFLTDSTVFLTSYKVRASQMEITNLQTKVADTREVLIPKKKFAFRTKTKKADIVQSTKIGSDSVDGSAKVQPKINIEMCACNFNNISKQELQKPEKDLNNNDVSLSNLDNCTVKLFGAPSTVHADNLHSCVILVGPVSGSVFVDNCKNCTFVVACQQLRIHSTTNTKFYVHVTSRAIIEDCTTVQFAKYNLSYEKIDDHYSIAELDRSRNNWNDIDDFNWLAADTHSPNWSLIDESDLINSWTS